MFRLEKAGLFLPVLTTDIGWFSNAEKSLTAGSDTVLCP